MNCKRCGAKIYSGTYICPNCKVLMDSEQIKLQKELMKNDVCIKEGLISEKYGGKKQLFEKRDDYDTRFRAIIVLFFGLLVIFLIVGIVYFL